MDRFRVLQFNMQFGQVWDDARPDDAPVVLEETLKELRRHDADILLLQEVERALPEGRQAQPPPNFTRLRQELPGYDSWFSYPKADPRELPFGLGLAIFSRTPLLSPWRTDLPSPPVEFEFMGKRTTPTDRLMIGATTRLAGRELGLFNTHLLAFFMLGSSEETHPAQRDLVAARVATFSGPAILGGDFNASRHEALVARFARRGLATVQEREITWRRRPLVLDHIFHNAALRCVAHQVIPSPASDHHALVADFEFVAA